MKVCPDCTTAYSDDFDTCEKCDVALLDAPDALPASPELADIVEVDPDEETAMVDLDAMQSQLRERAVVRAEEEAEANREEDPDETGTMNLSELKRKRGGADEEDETDLRLENTQNTQRTRGHDTRGFEGTLAAIPPTEDEEKGQGAIFVAIAAVTLVTATGIGIALWALFAQAAPISVTSIPSGAVVLIDGQEIGEAPLVSKTRRGQHSIELRLAGFATYKEIIQVGETGLNITQELQPEVPKTQEPVPVAPAVVDAGPEVVEPSGPTKAEMDAEFVRIKGLIDERQLDEAFTAIKAFVTLSPDDPRGDELFDALAKARTAKVKPQVTKLTAKEKAKRAQKLFVEGEGLYRQRRMGEARLKLLNALQYNPKMSGPHRVLARIYLTQKNTKRVRYHLQRYLRLGGKDSDFAVRRWLEDHPDK